MPWNHTQQTTIEVTSSALARAAYSTNPSPVSVNDAEAVEIVSGAETAQYFSISNSGPSSVFCQFGGMATSTVYSVVFPPGFHDNEIRVAANEDVSVIAATGETANLLVNVAPEVQI